MPILIHIAIIICIYIILAVSLNVAVGYTGLLNFGHIAFFGVGAYTSALLTLGKVPYGAAFIAGGLIAAALGFVITRITSRLRGEYLALATLGFGFIFQSIAVNWKSLTRGPLGIPAIPKPSFFGFHFVDNTTYLAFCFVVMILSVVVMYRVVNSRYGKLLQAVRDDAIGLLALGKNVSRLKYQCMMFSTFFMGLAGSLYAHYVTYIDPSTFTLAEVVLLFTIIIVGGIGSLRGSLVAGVIIITLPEMLRFVDVPSAVVGPARQIFYAAILLGIVLWRPRGLFGSVDLE